MRKARDRVYCPALNSDIKEVVTKCQVCAEFQVRNPQQPLQTHKIPDRPWSRLAADVFTLQSKEYIVQVDYYSDYVGVSPLRKTTSTAIIKFTRVRFSQHGMARSSPVESLQSSQNSGSFYMSPRHPITSSPMGKLSQR